MALDGRVYDLDAERRALPNGAVYARAGTAWALFRGRLQVIGANEPIWGDRGLRCEDAETNLLSSSTPGPAGDLSNAALYSFAQARSAEVFGTTYAHKCNGASSSPVREIDDPATSLASTIAGWALLEQQPGLDYSDVGFRAASGAWLHRARWDWDASTGTLLAGSGALLAERVPAIGPNGGGLVRLGVVTASAEAGRRFGVAPAGDYASHQAAIVHHLQVSGAASLTSPIVTAGAAATRQRATLVSTIQDPGHQQTVQLIAIAAIGAATTQVLWQQDADSDVGAVRVQRSAAGRLSILCGSTTLDLGTIADGAGLALALTVAAAEIRARLNGGAVQTLAITRPTTTRERWLGAKGAGAAWGGELVRARRWLSLASDIELMALATVPGQLQGLGNGSAGATVPLLDVDWASCRVPRVIRDSLSSPSSGDAYLIECYAGDFGGGVSKRTYRRKLAGERPIQGARRVQNFAPASGVPLPSTYTTGVAPVATITADGVDDRGNPAYRLVLSRDATSSSAIRYCTVDAARLNYRCAVRLRIKAGSSTNAVQVRLPGGAYTGMQVAPTADWQDVGLIAAGQGTALSIEVGLISAGVASLTANVLISCVQIEDLTGCDQAAPSEYIDPGIDHSLLDGTGGTGVRYFPTTCGNSLAGGVITEAAGAAIPDIIGWRAVSAATAFATNSPPTSGSLLDVTSAPDAVGGLPARRLSANATLGLHQSQIPDSTISPDRRTTYTILRRGIYKPQVILNSTGWYVAAVPNAEWSGLTTTVSGGVAEYLSGIERIYGDDYVIWLTVKSNVSETMTASLRVLDAAGNQNFGGAGEYLDVSVFNLERDGFRRQVVLAAGAAVTRQLDILSLPATLGSEPLSWAMEINVPSPPLHNTVAGLISTGAGNSPFVYMSDALHLYSRARNSVSPIAVISNTGAGIRRISGAFSPRYFKVALYGRPLVNAGYDPPLYTAGGAIVIGGFPDVSTYSSQVGIRKTRLILADLTDAQLLALTA